MKAAFLYKFAGYVDWPASAFAQPDSPFVIGILGAPEVAAELERLVPARSVSGRPVSLRRLKEGEGLRGVHLLFLGRSDSNLRAILPGAQQQSVLTVTESEQGLELGATINFVLLDDRIGFEVSLEVAERSGLKISSRMLAVARRVVPKT